MYLILSSSKMCMLVFSVTSNIALSVFCLETYFVCVLLYFRNSDKGVEVAFLGTRTGLSRINLFVGPEQLTNQ